MFSQPRLLRTLCSQMVTLRCSDQEMQAANKLRTRPFSPDGRFLASFLNVVVVIFSCDTNEALGEPICTDQGTVIACFQQEPGLIFLRGSARSLYSPDGKRLFVVDVRQGQVVSYKVDADTCQPTNPNPSNASAKTSPRGFLCWL